MHPTDRGTPHPDAPTPARSSAHAVSVLYQAGHYEQALSHATSGLESDPLNLQLHILRGFSLLALDRPKEARTHVEFAQENSPNEPFTHYFLARYHRELQAWKKARHHARLAVELQPEEADYHAELAILELVLNNRKSAKQHILTARSLDPQNADIINIAVQICGIGQETAKAAWERVAELEHALSLDPNNALIHASIGSIFLDDLEQPAEAECWFRSALALNPRDRDHQKLLFKAIGKQRFVYRVLSLPIRALDWLGPYRKGIGRQPLRGFLVLCFLLIMFKFVAIWVAWFVLAFLLFWPAAKFYEWLLIDEIRCASEASDRSLRVKWKLNNLPVWFRVSSFLILAASSWAALFFLLQVPQVYGFVGLAIFAGLHFLFTGLSLYIRKARSTFGRRAHERAKLSPPQGLSSKTSTRKNEFNFKLTRKY